MGSQYPELSCVLFIVKNKRLWSQTDLSLNPSSVDYITLGKLLNLFHFLYNRNNHNFPCHQYFHINLTENLLWAHISIVLSHTTSFSFIENLHKDCLSISTFPSSFDLTTVWLLILWLPPMLFSPRSLRTAFWLHLKNTSQVISQQI